MDLLSAGSHGNSPLLRIVEAILPRLQVPFPPGRDDFEFGSQRLVGKFEADLIVSLAGAAVCDRSGALTQSDLHLVLGDNRPRQRSPKQIFMLVHCTGLQRWKHVSAKKLLAHVFDDHLAGAGFVSLPDDGFDVVPLSHVSDHGDHVVGVVFLQPGNNDGGVESPGIGKHHFLRHEHSSKSSGPPCRPAVVTGWPSARAGGSPPDRTPPSAPNPSLRR